MIWYAVHLITSRGNTALQHIRGDMMDNLEQELIATKRKIARAMVEYVTMLERHEIKGRSIEDDMLTIYKKREAVAKRRLIK